MNFKEICYKKLEEKKLNHEAKYIKRLEWELSEVENQNKESYFLNLFEKQIKYKENQNNLLIPYILDIVSDFDIDKEPNFYQGDMPDIDTDYLPDVRDYLKNEWAIKTFGEDKVCNIGNYTTFGIKNALIDIAKVYGESREEILNITKNLQNKDEEGKPITWETAIRQDPALKKYCEEKMEVATAAKKLIDRNRGMGIHAGGLIVSSMPISDLVPLVKRKDDPQASSWVEGLHGQDLQPVGLVKFDLLVISNLLQIAHCCRLIWERHGIEKICAIDGKNNWSDVDAYRNDEQALKMADQGDLKCIFQFDSDGIRNLVKAGGVTRFEDLVAYSSLYRPGPLNQSMHERYAERKRGREDYELHPLLKNILDETYGVIIYQEQVMKILNVIGEIPMKDVETVRKAISKKKVESFIKYKEIFIKNGKNNLNCSKEEVEELWKLIESFAEYGFNRSIDKNTQILTPQGLKQIYKFKKDDKVYTINQNGETIETTVVNLHDHGILTGYKVEFDDGYEITCTLDHKFLTAEGQAPLHEIIKKKLPVLCEKNYGENYAKKKIRESKLQSNHGNNVEREISQQYREEYMERSLEYAPISDTRNLLPRNIIQIVPVGKVQMYDLEVASPTHNFLLPNGIVTSNSHAVAYTHISSRLLYLKSHYPHEFYTAILKCETDSDKIKEYKKEIKNHNIKLRKVDINKSKDNFCLIGDEIYFGFSNIKGIGKTAADKIVSLQPFNGFIDFIERFGTDGAVLKPLLASRCFTENTPVNLFKFAEYYKDFTRKKEDSKNRYNKNTKKNKEELLELINTIEESEEIKNKIKTGQLEKFNFCFQQTTCEQIKERYKNIIIDGKNAWKNVCKILNKISSAHKRFKEKENYDKPSLETFDFDSYKINSKIQNEIENIYDAEKKIYGFGWEFKIEKSKDFQGGFNFDKVLELKAGESAPVEAEILSVNKRKGKKTEYYQVKAEDSNGDEEVINIWKDDYELYKDELVAGNFIRIRLSPPTKGFKTFTLESIGPRNYYNKTKMNKNNDYRIILMEKNQ